MVKNDGDQTKPARAHLNRRRMINEPRMRVIHPLLLGEPTSFAPCGRFVLSHHRCCRQASSFRCCWRHKFTLLPGLGGSSLTALFFAMKIAITAPPFCEGHCSRQASGPRTYCRIRPIHETSCFLFDFLPGSECFRFFQCWEKTRTSSLE